MLKGSTKANDSNSHILLQRIAQGELKCADNLNGMIEAQLALLIVGVEAQL